MFTRLRHQSHSPRQLYRVGVASLSGILMSLVTAEARAADDPNLPKAISIYDHAAKDASLFDFSIGSPDTPFLPLANIGPNEIPTVETPRKFGVALATAFAGGSGKGAAIEFAPIQFTNPSLSLYRYNQLDWASRVYARSKLGAAFTPGVRADAGGKGAKASGVTISLATKFLDASDRLLAGDAKGTLLEQCLAGPTYQAAYNKRRDGVANLDSDALAIMQQRHVNPNSPEGDKITKEFWAKLDADLSKGLQDQFAGCEKQVEAAFRGRMALDGGVGLRLQGEPGKLKDLHGAGVMLWATFSSGDLAPSAGKSDRSLFNLHAQVVLHGRYTFKDPYYSDSGVHLGSRDSAFVAGAIEAVPVKDGNNRFIWSAQVAWTKQDAPSSALLETKKDYVRYSGLLGFKLLDGVWLKASGGHAQGKGIERDNFVSIGFSFSPVGSPNVIGKALDSLMH